jgi:hypothetical protein
LFRNTFIRGTRLALYHWRLLLPLYMVGLLLGLLQAWPMLAAGGVLRSPFLGELASGEGSLLDLWLGSPTTAGTLSAVWVLAALLASALFSLAYNFCSGGILAVYLGDEAEDARRQFWPACRRWFWSFVGLGALLIVLALLAAVVGAVLGALAGALAGTVAAALLFELANALGEYARALAVARDRRNPFALLGLAAGFLRRHFLGVLALALLGLLLHLALAGLYAAGARVVGGTPAAILWQQLAVLGWLWVKLLRLAWAASYVRAVDAPAAPVEGVLPLAA